MAKKKDMDGDGIPDKKDKDRDGDGIPNRRDKRPNKPGGKKDKKDPPDPSKNGGGGGGTAPGNGTKPPDNKDSNTTFFNIFSETPEIDESNADSMKELVDNLNKNLQSRAGELVARYSISEVDKLPKNFARSEKYNDEDRQIDFDDIVSEQGPDDIDTAIPKMLSPLDFAAKYKFGSSNVDGFKENVPNFLEAGTISWDLQLSIPDTIGVEDYIIEWAADE